MSRRASSSSNPTPSYLRYEFAGALHTGWMSPNGGRAPSGETVVTAMDDELMAGIFTPDSDASGWDDVTGDTAATSPTGSSARGAPSAYLFILDKRVSGQLRPLSARNVTLTLHSSVESAAVAPPGVQGAAGFAELRERHGLKPWPKGKQRAQRARIWRSVAGAVHVTLELIGGSGALVRLWAAPSASAELQDASFASVSWIWSPETLSIGARSPTLDFGLKASSWAYDAWPARYRPYEVPPFLHRTRLAV